MDCFATRRDRLRKLLKAEKAGGLLVTNFNNVTYLTGFTGDDSWLLIGLQEEVLITDFRYVTQLQDECPGLRLLVRKQGVTMPEATAEAAGAAKISQLGFEAGSLTVAGHGNLVEKLPKVELAPTTGLVEQLREIKDAEEIAILREAVQLAERGFAVLRASLRPEQTEQQIAYQLEHQLRLFGASGCSFTPIVAAGPRAALPHARAGDFAIGEHDLLLVDWGAQHRLYKSDLTRVLVTGKISPKLERVYGVVLKAQLAAINAIKPGVTGEEVDKIARKVIGDGGFGKNFGHGLGHGIGLDIHEMPRLGVNQKKPLKAGMVVTVAPGIYLPGWGGVRIEDDVLVTKNGHEVLSTTPKSFAEMVVA
ncbi:MAG: M24 family metallopeptidase [Pirellulales bacterium]